MVQVPKVLEQIHTQNKNVGFILAKRDTFIGRIQPTSRVVTTPKYIDTITRYTKISMDGQLVKSDIEGCVKYVKVEVRGLDLIGFLFTVRLDELYVCEE